MSSPNTARIESLGLIVIPDPDAAMIDGLPDRRLWANAISIPGLANVEITREVDSADNDNMKAGFYDESPDVAHDGGATPLSTSTVVFSSRAFGLGDLTKQPYHPDEFWMTRLFESGLVGQGSRLTLVTDPVDAAGSPTTFSTLTPGNYTVGSPLRVTIGGLEFFARVTDVSGNTITHTEIVSRTRVGGVPDTVSAAIDSTSFTASMGVLYADGDLLRTPSGETATVTDASGQPTIVHTELSTPFATGDAVEIFRDTRCEVEDARRAVVGNILRVDLGDGEEDLAITAVSGTTVTHNAASAPLGTSGNARLVSVVEAIPDTASVEIASTTSSDTLSAATATTATVNTPGRWKKHDIWKVSKDGKTEYITVDDISAATITYSGLPDGVTLANGDALRRVRRFENRAEQGPMIGLVYQRQGERYENWFGRLTKIEATGGTSPGERRVVLKFTVEFQFCDPRHADADPRPAVRSRASVAYFDRSRLALSKDEPSLEAVAADLHVSGYTMTIDRPVEPGGSSLDVRGASGLDTVMGSAMFDPKLSTPVTLFDLDFEKAPKGAERRMTWGCGPKLDGSGLVLQFRRAHMTASAEGRSTDGSRRVQEMSFRAGRDDVGAGSSFCIGIPE